MTTKTTKKNNTPLLLGLLITLLVCVVIAVCLIVFVATRISDQPAPSDERSATSGPEALQPFSSQDIIDLIANKSSGFLYVGRPTCPHCREFSPLLTKVVKAENLAVYYYDTDTANTDRGLKSQALAAINVTTVPTFMYIENGTIVGTLADKTSETAILDFINQYR